MTPGMLIVLGVVAVVLAAASVPGLGRRELIAATTAGVITTALATTAIALGGEDGARPTTAQAREATRMVFQLYADALGGKMRISERCPARGRASRVCRLRITGRDPGRYRVVVTGRATVFVVTAHPEGGAPK